MVDLNDEEQVAKFAMAIAAAIVEVQERKQKEKDENSICDLCACPVDNKEGVCPSFTSKQRKALLDFLSTKTKVAKTMTYLAAAALLWAFKDVYDFIHDIVSGLFESISKTPPKG